MIFKSEKWVLDTRKNDEIVSITNLTSGEKYEFFEDCIRYHIHYSEENFPERLQKLIDNGTVLEYLEDLKIRVTDTVNAQVEMWCSNDKNFQVANETGNLPEIERIANMYKKQAEHSAFEAMIYI